MGELTNWLWSPFLDPARVALGAVLVAVLAVCAVGALKAARVPGELGPAERKPVLAGRGGGGRAVAAGRYLIVLGVVLGAAALFFPPARPTTVLLSSRARLPSPGREWEAGWERAAAEEGLSAEGHYVDAGPVADRVFEELRRNPDRGRWQSHDPAAAAALAGAVRDAVAGFDPDPVPGPAAVSHASAPDLPAWMVESAELAVLKAVMQKRNVERVFAKVEDRPTGAGYAWDLAAPYLEADPVRYRRVAVKLAGRQLSDVPRVEVVVWADNVGGRFAVDALVSAGADPSARAVAVELEGRGGRAEATVPAGAPGLELVRFEFPAVPGPRPVALRQVAPLVRRCPVPAADPTPVVRVVGGDAGRWQKTWEVLTGPSPAFAGWRGQAADGRFDLAAVRFTGGDGSVVADAATFPGSVVFYPAGFDPRTLVAAPKVDPDAPLRGRRAAGESPGAYTWDRLALLKQEARPPGGGRVGSDRRPVVRVLGEGAAERPDPGPRTTPLTAVYPTGPAAAVAAVAVDPDAQRCLVDAAGRPPAGFDPDRMLAFWTAALTAVRRCSDPGVAETPGRGDAPTTVLTAADLQDLRADALAGNLVPLLAGVLLYAGLVARGIAAAPSRRESP